ncbi:hypothetical protein D3C73_678990 [compost metagenome]
MLQMQRCRRREHILGKRRINREAAAAHQFEGCTGVSPLKNKPSDITAEFAGPADSCSVDHLRSLQHMVRVPAQNGMNPLKLLRQPLICRKPQVGKDNQEIHLRSEQLTLFTQRFFRVQRFPAQQPVERGKCRSSPGNAYLDAILLQNDMALHPSGRLSGSTL